MKVFTGDVFFQRAPDEALVRAHAARGWGVLPARVAVRDWLADSPWPADADIVLLNLVPLPGDFPVHFDFYIEQHRMSDLPQVLTTLAHEFGTPVLADDTERYDVMNLYLPNGSVHDVIVDQDDDGGIRNTPEMRRLIEEQSGHATALTG